MLTISEFRPFVLKLMADKQARHRNAVIEEVSDLAGLTAAERAETIPSSNRRAAHRIGWALSSYIKSGILERIGRGVFQITPIGLEMAEKWKNAQKIQEVDLIGLPMWDAYLAILSERKTATAI